MNHAPKTANATFAATLCDQLCADGLTSAFVAPGSRSTPLALALVEHPEIAVEVFHDERSAAFAALGFGLATGKPGLVLCSSGTAGAHFYAAVIEADASSVPLIVCTADRPPELWGRGAPQTINQTHLYGDSVRAFLEPGPPDDLDSASWRAIAREMWQAATGSRPGPVHANLSFRDPLTGTPEALPPALSPLPNPASHPSQDLSEIATTLSTPRGVVIAGRSQTEATDILTLADTLGWPVIADHRSGCRDPETPAAIRHFDALLRDQEFGESQRPDVVLRIGEIVSSKAVSLWLSACAAAGTRVISSRPFGRHIDPESIASLQFDELGAVRALISAIDTTPDPSWLSSWVAADTIAAETVRTTLAASTHTSEIAIAQAAVSAVPSGGALVVSSSMPVRDVEWYGPNRNDITVFANRGANGIDGVIATAIGCALSGLPTICLIGDVAFLHDATSLTALSRRKIDLSIVVMDNDGGGIFSFLPQHSLLDPTEYELLFGTPHGTDLAGLVQAHGLEVETFDAEVATPNGVRVILARTNRVENLAIHDRLNAQVANAIGER